MPYYVLALLLVITYFLSKQALSFYKNLRAAQGSGIPYTISPVYGYDRFWLVTDALWSPLLRRLPKSLTHPWIDLISADWSWKSRYTPFSSAVMNSDTFLIVAPTRNILCTADADVINQITTRRNDFPKPIEVYASLDVFGKNVVTVEGGEWRRQRKLLTPQFNEKSNGVVWKESLFQAGEMVKSWNADAVDAKRKDEKESGSTGTLVTTLGKDAMRLSLHVISRAGFDVRCLWPGASDAENGAAEEGSMDSTLVPEGHKMSYTESLETLLHRIIAVLLLPDWLMKYSPWQLLRDARTSYKEWGLYMDEIYTRKTDAITSPKSAHKQGLDLMGAMIQSSGLIPGTPNHGKAGAGLSQSEIMGNSFVLFLAGHETAANSIHFAVLYLATRPDVQKKLQAELDEILGSTPTSEWDYDTIIPRLFSSLLGAIMNEELRLVAPVIVIPKSTLTNQPILMNGKDCIVPAGTYVGLNTVAVHRNPKYWPHGPCRSKEEGGPIHPTSNCDNDLEEFRPERWFLNDADRQKLTEKEKEEKPAVVDELEISGGPETSPSMFRPQKGSYIPFSEGYRACIGRRFAQVEILATLAVIYKFHSIELSTNEYASEEEIRGMSKEERGAIWGKAKLEAERKIREELGTVITLQFRGKSVDVRVCPRGEELFF